MTDIRAEQFDDEIQELEDLFAGHAVRSEKTLIRKNPTAVHEPPRLSNNENINQALVNTEMWAVYGGTKFSPCETSMEYLPCGQYTIERSDTIGLYFNLVSTSLDDLIELPDSVSEKVIGEIHSFWTKEQHFRNLGFMWKRGVLLWGPPGGGKTATLQIVSRNIVQSGGISIYVHNPSLAAQGLQLLRKIEPTRPLIVMLEDVDAIIDTHGETDLLAMMDGELQIDNVVFVATTNYPDRLDKRFVCRPSRFDSIHKVGMPRPAARKVYMSAKSKVLRDNPSKLEQWVRETEGFSIAHLKELIISVEVFEVSFDKAVKRLRTMLNKPITSELQSGFGFLGGDASE